MTSDDGLMMTTTTTKSDGDWGWMGRCLETPPLPPSLVGVTAARHEYWARGIDLPHIFVLFLVLLE